MYKHLQHSNTLKKVSFFYFTKYHLAIFQTVSTELLFGRTSFSENLLLGVECASLCRSNRVSIKPRRRVVNFCSMCSDSGGGRLGCSLHEFQNFTPIPSGAGRCVGIQVVQPQIYPGLPLAGLAPHCLPQAFFFVRTSFLRRGRLFQQSSTKSLC